MVDPIHREVRQYLFWRIIKAYFEGRFFDECETRFDGFVFGSGRGLGRLWQWPGFFHSPLDANSHYRPINFGMGYEMYVDLSSLETVKDDGQGWIFKVNLFRSPEDSGNIEGTYTLTYKVAHGQAWLYNDSTHSWQEIPMRKKEIKHNQIADFVAVNLCYKQKTGQYLNDDYGYAKGMERYYKGE